MFQYELRPSSKAAAQLLESITGQLCGTLCGGIIGIGVSMDTIDSIKSTWPHARDDQLMSEFGMRVPMQSQYMPSIVAQEGRKWWPQLPYMLDRNWMAIASLPSSQDLANRSPWHSSSASIAWIRARQAKTVTSFDCDNILAKICQELGAPQ